MKTLINTIVVTVLVAAYQAAKRLSLMFALSGYEIDQYECWGNTTPKVTAYMGMQDFIREKATKPLNAAIEARVGDFLILGGKIVLR